MHTYEIRQADESVHWIVFKTKTTGPLGERPSLPQSLPPVTILEAKDLADVLNVHEAEKVNSKV